MKQRIIRQNCIGVLIIATFLICHPPIAQVLYGTLVGVVTAPDGKAVAGARVTATEVQTGIQHQETTDASVNYGLRNLQPGVYNVEVTASGFGLTRRSGLAVSANQIVRDDESLSIANLVQSVNVDATASQMQTDSASIHGEISPVQLSNLPIGGYSNYQSAQPDRRGYSIALSECCDGYPLKIPDNVTSVDGAAIQQIYPHHTLYNPPTEDIQQVDIVTNSFGAEQGLAGGAAVSVITKSGTNNFHGTLWEEHTNSAMAAKNCFYNKTYFAGAGNAPPKNILNQFGANLGGPILHNKLFFFTGFEGLSQRQLYAALFSLPTDAERNGDFTGLPLIYDPSTGNPDGTGRKTFASENSDGRNAIEKGISPSASKMLALIPHANLPGTSNNYSTSGIDSLDRFSFDEKLTWQIDPKSSLFGKFSYLLAEVQAPSSLGVGGGSGLISSGGSGFSQSHVYVGGLGYTRILSKNLLFDANFGMGLNDVAVHENDYATNLGPGLGIPGTNSDGNGRDYRPLRLETFGNPDSWTPELRHDFTYTYVANLTWVHGAHNGRVGVQVLNNRMNEYQPQRGFGPRGEFTFTGGVTALKGGSSPNSANSFAQFSSDCPIHLVRATTI